MTYKEHLNKWQKAFEDRGTMYMVHLLQEVLDQDGDVEENMKKELDKWLHIKQTTRLYGTRHAEAWAKSDMLREVMRWYGEDHDFSD